MILIIDKKVILNGPTNLHDSKYNYFLIIIVLALVSNLTRCPNLFITR